MDVRFARYAEYQQRRVEAGAATVREVGREEIAKVRKSASTSKTAFADMLMDNIFEDIEAGEPGGSYYLDGTRATRGYAVGGYEGGFRRAEELAVSKGDIEDPEDLRAAIELMDEEARRLMAEGDVVIGYWLNDRGQVVFDVSNIFSDEQEAIEVGLSRFEEEIWSLSDDSGINLNRYM